MTLNVLTKAECTDKNGWYTSEISSGMICGTFDKGTLDSACNGDSPSLIIPKSSTDNTAVVIGAFSFGPPGCDYSRPGVFTHVAHYINWIRQKMEF